MPHFYFDKSNETEPYSLDEHSRQLRKSYEWISYVPIFPLLMTDPRLKPEDVLVFGCITLHTTMHGSCKLTNEELSKITNKSEAGVQATLKRLKAVGLVRIGTEYPWKKPGFDHWGGDHHIGAIRHMYPKVRFV